MGKETFQGPLEQVDECCWRIPKSYKEGMRVDGLIFSDEKLLEQVKKDQAPDQVANVAFLPGIQHASLAMPDIHWGYGFCIGGVCATDPEEGGVISPGGVGYDINCGVRLVKSNLYYQEVKYHLKELVDQLFRDVPTGVGKSGRFSFKTKELDQLMTEQNNQLLSMRDPHRLAYTTCRYGGKARRSCLCRPLQTRFGRHLGASRSRYCYLAQPRHGPRPPWRRSNEPAS